MIRPKRETEKLNIVQTIAQKFQSVFSSSDVQAKGPSDKPFEEPSEEFAERTLETLPVSSSEIDYDPSGYIAEASVDSSGSDKSNLADADGIRTIRAKRKDSKLNFRRMGIIAAAVLVLSGAAVFTGSQILGSDDSAHPALNKLYTSANVSNCETVLACKSFIYDGEEKTPNVIVGYDDEILTKGTDYTIAYMNNSDPGTASAVIRGIGKYSGMTKVDYDIIVGSVSDLKCKYDGNAAMDGSSKIKLSWKANSAYDSFLIKVSKDGEIVAPPGSAASADKDQDKDKNTASVKQDKKTESEDQGKVKENTSTSKSEAASGASANDSTEASASASDPVDDTSMMYTASDTHFEFTDLEGKGTYEFEVYAVAGSATSRGAAGDDSDSDADSEASESSDAKAGGSEKTDADANAGSGTKSDSSVKDSAAAKVDTKSDSDKKASSDEKADVNAKEDPSEGSKADAKAGSDAKADNDADNDTGNDAKASGSSSDDPAADTGNNNEASNANDEAEDSLSISTAETASCKLDPLKKPDITIESPGSKFVTVKWKPVSLAESYKVVEYDSAGNEILSTDVPADAEELKTTFFGLTPGNTYSYKVRAEAKTEKGKTISGKYSDSLSATAGQVQVGQACNDERGKVRGGRPGDQTGKEVRIGNFKYSSKRGKHNNWRYVARFKDPEKAAIAAQAMRDACENDHIGYDQRCRKNPNLSAFTYAKAADWDISAISTNCAVSCSPLVSMCVNAAGVQVPANWDTSDSSMKRSLINSGEFEILTDSKYLTSDSLLEPGDILVSPNKHTAMVI